MIVLIIVHSILTIINQHTELLRISRESTKMSAVHKLYYFDIPGKGEAIRLAFTYAGIPFEDVRLGRDDWIKLKEEGKFKFGQLPALETPDGTVLVQSAAIVRYVGRLASGDTLYPANDLVKAAFIDSIIDQEADMFTGVGVFRYKGRFGFGHLEGNTEELATIAKALEEDTLPRHLGFLSKLLEASTTGWIAGTEGPSIADFILVPRLEWLNNGQAIEGFTNVLDKYENLKGLIAKFYEIPAVKDYYKK